MTDQPLTPEQHKVERAAVQVAWEGLLIVNTRTNKLTSQMELLIMKTLRQLSRLEQIDAAAQRAADMLGLKGKQR